MLNFNWRKEPVYGIPADRLRAVLVAASFYALPGPRDLPIRFVRGENTVEHYEAVSESANYKRGIPLLYESTELEIVSLLGMIDSAAAILSDLRPPATNRSAGGAARLALFTMIILLTTSGESAMLRFLKISAGIIVKKSIGPEHYFHAKSLQALNLVRASSGFATLDDLASSIDLLEPWAPPPGEKVKLNATPLARLVRNSTTFSAFFEK